MAKGFGVSPITNTIYYGTQDPVKQMWTGKKEDVTDKVIAVVFEWFIGNMEEDTEEYSITYPSTGFELVMRRKEPMKTKEPDYDVAQILEELHEKAVDDSEGGVKMFKLTSDGHVGEESKDE